MQIRQGRSRGWIGGIAAGMMTIAGVGMVSAQEFPTKPIKIVIGLAAGGITDITTRIYADAVTRTSGWQFVVENRAGAAGATAAIAVQNSDPDGYTLLVFSGSQHATVAAMGQVAYEPVKGFTPITVLFNSVVVLVVPGNSKATSLAELHAIGRKTPDGLTMATPGVGSPSHLLGAKVAMAEKVPVRAVHFRGGAPMMADLISGRIDIGWATVSTAKPFIVDGKLRGLVVDSDERSRVFPNIPTLRELGLGNEKVAPWFALAGPAGIPAPVATKLRDAFVKASNDPLLRQRIEDNGTVVATSTSEEMGRLMTEEFAAMQKLVVTLGLRK